MEFKDRLKRLRHIKEISAGDLAKQLNKAESTVRTWEIGGASPDIATLVRLCEIFECSANYLLGLSNIPHAEKNFIHPNARLPYFDEYLLSLGYKVDGTIADGGYLWIEHDGKAYSGMRDDELKQLEHSVKSYTRFLLHELMSKDKKPMRLKKAGD